jgi:glycosyltransferase involved in cell wall biosynthesis
LILTSTLQGSPRIETSAHPSRPGLVTRSGGGNTSNAISGFRAYVNMLGRSARWAGEWGHAANLTPVASLQGRFGQPQQAVADPDNPDMRFWREEVAPHVDGDRVRWVGTVAGAARDDLVASARVALFPLRWNEPGGTAVVESLALGTPVAGIALGCLPELVEHGRTGLITTTEDELGELVHAARDIDEAECRLEAARRFTPAVMAEAYLGLYERISAPHAA